MSTKLDQVRRLLAEGYELDEIESGSETMEARFRRGSRILTITFGPSEAAALLFEPGPWRVERRR
jgi:hypothetical protein